MEGSKDFIIGETEDAILWIDVEGFFVYGQAGFRGHLLDSVCIEYTQMPRVPEGLHIMADSGFVGNDQVMVPLRRGQGVPDALRQQINR